jgi:hypothetical protein
MNEPVTLVTDYILAIASAIFGVLLWRRKPPAPHRLWALAFFFTAAGTFFGGTYHGFGGAAWWKATVYSIGLASLFLLAGATRNRAVRAIAVVGFAVYAIWMVNHDDFLFVIIDYGATLIAVTIVQIAAWMRDRAPSAPWVIGSVIVSIIAAVVQQAPIPFHNDVYHAIQLLALWLLYRGGTFMTTATERSMIQPM